MKAGPLGRQAIRSVPRNPDGSGSSPKADVYLFKDGAIEPRHALIHDRGGRFEIEDMNTPDGTYVNGVPVSRSRSSKSAIRSCWARLYSSLHSRNPVDWLPGTLLSTRTKSRKQRTPSSRVLHT